MTKANSNAKVLYSYQVVLSSMVETVNIGLVTDKPLTNMDLHHMEQVKSERVRMLRNMESTHPGTAYKWVHESFFGGGTLKKGVEGIRVKREYTKLAV